MILVTKILPEGEKLADMAIRLGLTLAVAFLAQRALFLIVSRVEKWMVRAGHGGAYAEQRAHTLGQIFRHLCTLLVAGTATIHGLAALGWDVRPLVAGAGILGVALGFGAQTLVRDVIAGMFILVEDQFSVGDLIELNGKVANVEAITVRSTTLRDFNGYLHFVPNGEMKIVVNRSRGWQRLSVDVPIATDQELGPALELCRRAAEEFSADPRWKERLLDPVQVWGVEALTGAEAQVRMVVRAKPGPDAPEAARELRRRVHHALLAGGIRLSASREAAAAPAAAGPS